MVVDRRPIRAIMSYELGDARLYKAVDDLAQFCYTILDINKGGICLRTNISG